MREDLYLPSELYTSVVSYIPPRTRRNLYSVNHAFFDAAMDARYSCVRLASLKEKAFMRNLIRLSDPFVAKRVQSLHINANFIVQAEQHHDTWKESNPGGELQVPPLRIRNSRGHVMPSAEAVLEAIREFLPLLTSVSELSFVMNKDIPIKTAYGNAQALARDCMEAFKNTVRVLNAGLVYDTVPKIFPQTLRMPHLDSINIELGRPRSSIVPKGVLPVLQTLSIFVRNCNSSSRSISLCLPDPERPRDGFTPLLREIAAIPNLTSLHLCLPFLRISRRKFVDMLAAHSNTLKILKLTSFPISSFATDNAMTWLRTNFPTTDMFSGLEVLEIGRSILLPEDASYLNGQWLHLFHSLAVLSIKDNADEASDDSVYSSQWLRQLPTRENLRCLRLDITDFDEYFLPALMNNFPNLKWLYLNFKYVSADAFHEDGGHAKSCSAVSFKEILEKANISRWKIEHLRLRCSNYTASTVRHMCEFFREVVPSLKTCKKC